MKRTMIGMLGVTTVISLLMITAGCGLGTNSSLNNDLGDRTPPDAVDDVTQQTEPVDVTKIHTYRNPFTRTASVVGDAGAAESYAALRILDSPGGSTLVDSLANHDGSFRIDSWTGGSPVDNRTIAIQQKTDVSSYSNPVTFTFIPTITLIP